MDAVRFVYQPLMAGAARRVLIGRCRSRGAPEQGRFTRRDLNRMMADAWNRYSEQVRKLPPQPTLGSAMNVRLACFTLSFLDALLAAGVERRYAIELIADAAWSIYRRWARIALGLARTTPWRRTVLGFATVGKAEGGATVRLLFPFNAPGYLVETRPAARGMAFDVVRCPVADIFRAAGAADLCLESWCNLDYALAEMTRDELVRTKTLVGGGDRCDFRLNPS